MASLNWHLVLCGISHKSSTLEDREMLQINKENLAATNVAFNKFPDVKESVILSTCNRVEFYFVAAKNHEPFDIIKDFYLKMNHVNISGLQGKFYIKRNGHAADHLFRVASGIDSMVLGENQIFGQLKEAYSSACSMHTSGKVIHRLFHQAFRVGKSVRTDTEMGKGSCSVSSAAIDLLKDRISGIDKPNFLFVGVNQMISLAASNIVKNDYGKIIFANRTEEKAETMAKKFGASGYGLDKLEDLMTEVDVVITCTGSPLPVISMEMLKKTSDILKNKKLTIVDLAIPRDVETGSESFNNIIILDIEDIHNHVKNQQAIRAGAIPQAEEIIQQKLNEFVYWFDQVKQEPIYNGLGDAFNSIYQQELGMIIDDLEPDLREKFEKAGKKMMKKLLTLKAGEKENFTNGS